MNIWCKWTLNSTARANTNQIVSYLTTGEKFPCNSHHIFANNLLPQVLLQYCLFYQFLVRIPIPILLFFDHVAVPLIPRYCWLTVFGTHIALPFANQLHIRYLMPRQQLQEFEFYLHEQNWLHYTACVAYHECQFSISLVDRVKCGLYVNPSSLHFLS